MTHKKYLFLEIPTIGFTKNEMFCGHLAKAALPKFDEVGRSQPCVRKRPHCQLCHEMNDLRVFK